MRSVLIRRSASGAIARSSASDGSDQVRRPVARFGDRDAPHRLDARVAARQAVAEVVADRRIAGDENRALGIAELARVRQRQQRLAEQHVRSSGQRRGYLAGIGQIAGPPDGLERLRGFANRHDAFPIGGGARSRCELGGESSSAPPPRRERRPVRRASRRGGGQAVRARAPARIAWAAVSRARAAAAAARRRRCRRGSGCPSHSISLGAPARSRARTRGEQRVVY